MAIMAKKKKHNYSYDNDIFDDDDSYGGYSYWGGGWYWLSTYKKDYSWAYGMNYIQPDHKRIRDELAEKQMEYNKKWYPLKIEYIGNKQLRELTDTGMSVIRIWACDSDDVDKIMGFREKTESFWMTAIDEWDELIMNMACRFPDWRYPDWYYIEDESGDSIKDPVSWDYMDDRWAMRNWYNYDVFKKRLQEKQKEEKPEEKLSKLISRWGIWPDFECMTNKENIKKIAHDLLNRLSPPKSPILKEPNLRAGKRINRKFINGLSYKPLMKAETMKLQKKRVLNIVDWSWSMGWYTSWEHLYKATNFMYAIEQTWFFNCDSFFSESNTLSKAVGLCHGHSWGEWFDELLNRLMDMGYNPNNYDYIFIFTDCNIWQQQENVLNEILSNKKHILFSFDSYYMEDMMIRHKSLKYKYVNNPNAMIEELVNYI